MPAVFLSLRTPFFACPEPPECDRRRVLFSPRPTASTTSAETWVRLRAWHRLGAWDVHVELVSVKAGNIQLAPSKGSPHRLHGRLTQRDASSSISSASRKPAAKTKTLRARRRHLRASHRGFNVTQTHGRLCTRGLGVKWMMETPAGVQAISTAGRGGEGRARATPLASGHRLTWVPSTGRSEPEGTALLPGAFGSTSSVMALPGHARHFCKTPRPLQDSPMSPWAQPGLPRRDVSKAGS